MLYFWALVPLLQVIFAIHAYKHGNTFWMYIILFFPGIGAVIYFFVEYLPFLQRGLVVKSVAGSIEKRMYPARELQRLKDEVALNNCVANRVALAEGYRRSGDITQTITLLETCLEGVYKNDPQLLLTMAVAYYEGLRYTEAIDKLTLIRTFSPVFKDKEVTLLVAMCREGCGEMNAALAEYESILKVSTGEEARCRYAIALKNTGRLSDAIQQFETILKNARISPAYYKSSEKTWIKIATNVLQQIQSRKTTN